MLEECYDVMETKSGRVGDGCYNRMSGIAQRLMIDSRRKGRVGWRGGRREI